MQICETREEFNPKYERKSSSFLSELEKQVHCENLFTNEDIDKEAGLPIPPKKVTNRF